jgi:hypothetical protein
MSVPGLGDIVSLEDIADIVGHESTVTTEKVYRKVIVPELRRGAKSWTGYSADMSTQLSLPRCTLMLGDLGLMGEGLDANEISTYTRAA